MSKIARFVIWICSKFTKREIEQIIAGLLDVLEDRNPEVKPKDDFKEKHPNYRNFSVDPLAPLGYLEMPMSVNPILFIRLRSALTVLAVNGLLVA